MPATVEAPMAKRNDVVVKVDANVIRDAKVVAAFREVSLAEYLSELLRPLVSRDLEGEMSKRSRQKEKGAK